MINLRKKKKLLAAFMIMPAMLFSINAWAAAPKVTASIKPIHSWVAAVMAGVGTPQLIVKGIGSEHGYALRPKDAEELAQSDIVFWAGPDMETFLIKPLDSLAEKANKIALSQTTGIKLIDMREGGMFEAHHHDDGEDDHNHDHDHDHAHDDKHDHDHAHDHHHKDLHFWLDPENAKIAVKNIADVLSKKDTEHAQLYQTNAARYIAKLDDLIKNVNQELAPARGKAFIVFHDGYQYFEKRFNIAAAGSITVNPEQAPSVQRIADIREKIKNLKSVCIFVEPQFEPHVVKTIQEGTQAKIGELDPLGYNIAQGPQQYQLMIENIASSLKKCLSQ